MRKHPTTAATLAGAVAAATVLTGCGGAAGPTSQETVTVTASPSPAQSPSSAPSAQASRSRVPPGQHGTPRAGAVDLTHLDRRSITAVVDAALTISGRHDTRIDNSPADAQRRAAPLLTDKLAGALGEPLPGGGDAHWLTGQKHHGWTTVQLKHTKLGTDTPNTATTAGLCRLVTTTWHGYGHWHGPASTQPECVQLTRHHRTDPWQVAGITVASTAGLSSGESD